MLDRKLGESVWRRCRERGYETAPEPRPVRWPFNSLPAASRSVLSAMVLPIRRGAGASPSPLDLVGGALFC